LAYAVAAVVGVLGVARAVRLVTSDDWPPTKAIRDWWVVRTAARGEDGIPLFQEDGEPVPGPWTKLLTCPFCFAPYPTAVALAAAIWAGVWSPELDTLVGWWWVLAVWAAGSYAAAMVVVRDEPPPVD
jgi:hypothetical protein